MPGLDDALTAIWARLLNRNQCARDADFFALGGHPALLMAVGAEIREAFGVDLSQRQLFDATTIADQAVLVACALVERVRGLDPAAADAILAD